MTINPTKVRTTLTASSTLLDGLNIRLVHAVTNARLAMDDPKGRDDRPVSDRGRGPCCPREGTPDCYCVVADSRKASGSISDPTAAAALRGIAWNERVFDDLEVGLEVR